MKKIFYVFVLMIGFVFLFLGLATWPRTKDGLSELITVDTRFQHTSDVVGKKVYPKASTAKGLAPDLYLPDNPTPAVIKINEAKQAYFEERYKDACDLWRDALNLRPNHPEGIWHDIGLCSKKLYAWDDAIEAYTKAIELNKTMFHKKDKDLYDLYHLRAYTYLTKHDLEKAKEDFLKLTSIDPNDTSSYYQLAYIEGEQNNIEKAIFYLDSILEQEPRHFSAISEKSEYLAKLNKKQDAKKFLMDNKSAAENGTSNQKANFYYSLGVVNTLNHDADSALAAYQLALHFNPYHPYAESELCDIYARKGRGEEAIQHCQKGMDIFDYPRVGFRLCKAFAVAKQYDKGLKYCKALQKGTWKDSIEVYECCAMNKAGLGDAQGALDDIKNAREKVDVEIKKHEKEPDRYVLYLYGLDRNVSDLDKLENDIKHGKYAQ